MTLNIGIGTLNNGLKCINRGAKIADPRMDRAGFSP